MYRIKDLTEEELARLEASCSSFHLSYSKSNKFKKQVNTIKDQMSTEHEDEVWLLVTCAIRAIRQNNRCSKISLNKNHYTEARKSGFKLSYKKFRVVLSKLELHNYLSLYVGHYNSKDKENSLTSIVQFHDKFVNLFDKEIVDKSIKLVDDKDLIEVRNSITKEIIANTRIKNINPLRREVKAYNELLNNTEINVLGVSCGVVYKRIFMDDLSCSGRWYSGSFQTLKSKYRPEILFDGEPTVELDITSIHPCIIACMEGVVLSKGHKTYECYKGLIGNQQELRKLFKQALLSMLYTKDSKSAKASLYKHYLDHKEKYSSIEIKTGIITEILDRLVRHNPFLENHLHKEDAWKRLQYLDSSICRYVINSFVSEGIPILTYHDSFVVPMSQEDRLRSVVAEAWFHVLGTKDNLSLK